MAKTNAGGADKRTDLLQYSASIWADCVKVSEGESLTLSQPAKVFRVVQDQGRARSRERMINGKEVTVPMEEAVDMEAGTEIEGPASVQYRPGFYRMNFFTNLVNGVNKQAEVSWLNGKDKLALLVTETSGLLMDEKNVVEIQTCGRDAAGNHEHDSEDTEVTSSGQEWNGERCAIEILAKDGMVKGALFMNSDERILEQRADAMARGGNPDNLPIGRVTFSVPVKSDSKPAAQTQPAKKTPATATTNGLTQPVKKTPEPQKERVIKEAETEIKQQHQALTPDVIAALARVLPPDQLASTLIAMMAGQKQAQPEAKKAVPVPVAETQNGDDIPF
jgi:hypothetical protein